MACHGRVCDDAGSTPASRRSRCGRCGLCPALRQTTGACEAAEAARAASAGSAGRGRPARPGGRSVRLGTADSHSTHEGARRCGLQPRVGVRAQLCVPAQRPGEGLAAPALLDAYAEVPLAVMPALGDAPGQLLLVASLEVPYDSANSTQNRRLQSGQSAYCWSPLRASPTTSSGSHGCRYARRRRSGRSWRRTEARH